MLVICINWPNVSKYSKFFKISEAEIEDKLLKKGIFRMNLQEEAISEEEGDGEMGRWRWGDGEMERWGHSTKDFQNPLQNTCAFCPEKRSS